MIPVHLNVKESAHGKRDGRPVGSSVGYAVGFGVVGLLVGSGVVGWSVGFNVGGLSVGCGDFDGEVVGMEDATFVGDSVGQLSQDETQNSFTKSPLDVVDGHHFVTLI